MDHAGPPLEKLLRRMTLCPVEFWNSVTDSAPAKRSSAKTKSSSALVPPSHGQVTAIVCDYFRRFEPDLHPTELAQSIANQTQEQCGIISLLIWLLADEWFTAKRELVPEFKRLIDSSRLGELARLVPTDKIVSDPDRREEFVRLVLAELELRPEGESIAQATDRLNTLDTKERTRVLQATLAAERRARQVREAMARAKAQESVSRYGE